jgi:predicted component of type VI protein secretion system
MAIVNFSPVINTRAREFSQVVDTTATGQKDVIMFPPDVTGFYASWRGLSTSVVKVQITTSTQAEVIAATAIWVDLGSTSTTGTIQTASGSPVPTAMTFVVNTGLAGNQGYWAIRCNCGTQG